MFHKANHLPDQFSKLQLLPDLSKHTLQLHSNLSTITKVLRNYRILHCWKYPAKLTITHNGVMKTIYTLNQGLQLFCSWDIIPEQLPSHPASNNPRKIPPEWQKVPQWRSPQHQPSGGSWTIFKGSPSLWLPSHLSIFHLVLILAHECSECCLYAPF